MNKKSIPLFFILFFSLIVFIPALTPIQEANALATSYSDVMDWEIYPIQNRFVYFENGFWNNQSKAVAIFYQDSTINEYYHVLWYNIPPTSINQLLEPYADDTITSTGAINNGDIAMLQYNSTSVIVAIFEDEGNGADLDEAMYWSYHTAINDTTIEEQFNTYDPTTSVGNNKGIHSMSNMVKLGVNYYVAWTCTETFAPNQVAFTIFSQAGQVHHGARPNGYLSYPQIILGVSSNDLGSTNNPNLIYWIMPSVHASGINGDNKPLIYTSDVGGIHAYSNVETNGTFPTLNTHLNAFDYEAGQSFDFGGGTTYGIITSYRTQDSNLAVTNNQWSHGSGQVNDSASVTWAGGINVYRSFGRFDTIYSGQTVYDEAGSKSAVTISSFGVGSGGAVIVAGLNYGVLGAVLGTNTVRGYQHETEFQIEIDNANKLRVFSLSPTTPAPVQTIINEVGFGADLINGLTQTLEAGKTYFYLDNLENIYPTIATRLESYHIGNATNTGSYTVSVGIYTASNQKSVGMVNPLGLIYSRDYSYTGESAFNAYNITAMPNIIISPNSYGAVAISSSANILVNRTALTDILYSTDGYLPPTINKIDSEGQLGIALALEYQQQTVSTPQGQVDVATSQYQFTQLIQNVGISFGIDVVAWGIMIWLIALLIVVGIIATISSKGAQVPTPIYAVASFGVTFALLTVGLIPTWYGIIIIMASIGLGSWKIVSTITGGGGGD